MRGLPDHLIASLLQSIRQTTVFIAEEKLSFKNDLNAT